MKHTFLARIGPKGIQAARLHVPMPPVHGRCGRCGGPRRCVSCQARYTKAILRAIALTDEEHTTLEALLAECRAMDQRRAAERGR